MSIALVVLIWFVNFGISIWNAYAVGLAWVETKHNGGWPRVMAWSGAVMSACGFSWCYLIVLAFAAHGMEWLDLDSILLMLRFGYVLLIPAILSSGMTIMLDSWARAYRTRRLRDIGTAAWNTFAELHDVYNAIQNYDSAFGSVVDAFRKGGSSDDKTGCSGLILVTILVFLALFGGILTTMVIINRVAGNQPLIPKNYKPVPDADGYEPPPK